MAVAVDVAVAELDGGRRRISDVAIRSAIAVVHRTDEDALAALPVAATTAPASALLLAIAVFEETLLAGGWLLLPGRLLLARLGLLGLLGLRLLSLVLGRILCLAIGRGTFVALAATTAAMATGSLVLPLIGRLCLCRDRILRGLRLVLLCCHACTSWCDGLCVPEARSAMAGSAWREERRLGSPGIRNSKNYVAPDEDLLV
jgi:hypothetical protein